MPSTIIQSGSEVGVGWSNQKTVARTSDGKLWRLVKDGSVAEFHYSTNEGATWIQAASTITDFWYGSLVILEDKAYVAYVANSSQTYCTLKRGTPNAGMTDFTWSAGHNLAISGNIGYPDLVVHVHGSDHKAHVVFTHQSPSYGYVYYGRVTITSAGSMSNDTVADGTLHHGQNTSGLQGVWRPSIELYHSGNGVTVKNSTPHVFVSYGITTAGAGRGIRYHAIQYNGSTWVIGTEQLLDSTRYVPNEHYWLKTLYDPSLDKVVVVGEIYDGTNNNLVMYEIPPTNPGGGTTTVIQTSQAVSEYLYKGQAALDKEGNIYFVGGASVSSNLTIIHRKWNRATTTLENVVSIEALGQNTTHWNSSIERYVLGTTLNVAYPITPNYTYRSYSGLSFPIERWGVVHI